MIVITGCGALEMLPTGTLIVAPAGILRLGKKLRLSICCLIKLTNLNIYMTEDTAIQYKNHEIYLNKWGEYCICDLNGNMLAHNSSRKTLEEAKEYIDNL